MRKPEDMIWYIWESVHSEAQTARTIGVIAPEECEKYTALSRKVSDAGIFTLGLREEACQLELDLEKHRPALEAHYAEQEKQWAQQ